MTMRLMNWARFLSPLIPITLTLACSTDIHGAINYASKLTKQGKYDEAIKTLIPYLSRRPDNAELLGQFCSLYYKEVRYDDARRTCGKLLKLKPNEPKALFNLGASMFFSGRPETGITYGKRAFDSDPHFKIHIETLVSKSPKSIDSRTLRFAKACLFGQM